MRSRLVVASLIGVFVVAGCGGGGGGSGGTGSGAVAGKIVKRDGSTLNLGGVRVACTENGAADVSDASGSFDLHVPHGTVVHLDVKDPTADDDGGKQDGGKKDDDGSIKIKGGEVEVGEFQDGDSCEIEIEIENGEIVRVHMSKHDGKGGADHSGKGVLLSPTKGEAYGEVEVEEEHGCLRLEIEARGLALDAQYDVSLLAPKGIDAVLLGHVTVSDEGHGHFVFEACGANLPFGALSVADLAASMLVVQDAGGTVVLQGEFPTPGTEKDDGKDDDGVDEGKEGSGRSS